MKYIARISGADGRKLYQTGEHDSREAAATEAFKARPGAKDCATGYGHAGSFNIQWQRRRDVITGHATQVRFADGSSQWVELSIEDCKALPGFSGFVSHTLSFNVTNWGTMAPTFSDESLHGRPWPIQRDYAGRPIPAPVAA